jgi:hypothetical protein
MFYSCPQHPDMGIKVTDERHFLTQTYVRIILGPVHSLKEKYFAQCNLKHGP